MEQASNNSKDKEPTDADTDATAGQSAKEKMNLLKKKLKVMRTALKDENTARLTIEKELEGAYERIESLK